MNWTTGKIDVNSTTGKIGMNWTTGKVEVNRTIGRIEMNRTIGKTVGKTGGSRLGGPLTHRCSRIAEMLSFPFRGTLLYR